MSNMINAASHPTEVNPAKLASFGLTLARTQDNAIAIAVGTISNMGVNFELPGFRASICQLPIDRDEPSNAVQLERKKGKKP